MKKLLNYIRMKKYKLFKPILIILILSLLCTIFSFDFSEFFYNEDIYGCTINQNLDYQVKIFNSDLFQEQMLDSGETYISDIVDDIYINFKYEHISEDEKPLTLLYSVEATTYILNAEDKDEADSVIKESKHVIKDKEVKDSSNPKDSSFEDTIVINYDEFDKEIEKFKETIFKYSYCKLVLKIDVQAIKQTDVREVSITSESTVTIPLDEDSFTISKDCIEKENKNIKKFENPQKYINYWLLIPSLIIAFLDVLVLFLILKYKREALKSKREIQVENIFSEYGENIVKTVNVTDFNYKNVILVPNIKDIVNLSELAKEPVLYYEKQENEKTESIFCIEHNNCLYKFVIY